MPTEPDDSAGAYVEALYDADPMREWERLARHRTEFAVTRRALLEHLPPPPARVLDCGGGPGRYAVELARLGYEVTLFDLSSACLRVAREQALAVGMALAGYEHGTATDLSRFCDDAFDAVLLMGPLYHLLDDAARRAALREARRVLRPGGVLFAACITRYAPLRYAAKHDPTHPVDHPDELDDILSRGLLPPRGGSTSAFSAYFARPGELAPMLWESGYEVAAVLGVEGLVSQVEEGINELEGGAWEAWADLNYRLASDPALHGGAEHLLAVAVRPAWRAVLRKVALALQRANVAAKVVGGASLPLHRVPVTVKDIDLEMASEDAYRFAETFASSAVLPVAWRESAEYRSHYGQFRIDGVLVEAIGDLQRREREAWVPSMTRTHEMVDLEGVQVQVPWLEEETLAYIRRGRLERAALCLSYCQPQRLRALLRGEVDSNVF